MNKTPIADRKDQNDDRIARWGRSRNEGYRKFKHGFIQPAPFFFTQDHHPLWIADRYRGRSCFLIAGGPSFGALDHHPLVAPGILTMGINNSPVTIQKNTGRSVNMHCSVDSPDHWVRSIWLNPTIEKFAPICLASKFIFNSDTWQFMDVRVGDCPNVVFYKRNEHFQAKQFLWEDCFNWGNHSERGGGRSILLVAIRTLFLLGIRRVYLLGVDFKMDEKTGYHFEQGRNRGSINGNNSTYKKMNEWFKELRPLFEKEDFHVFNCNPDSGLKAFDMVSYKDALEEAHSHMDFVDIKNERTRGLYDTKAEDKRKGIGK